MDLSVIGRWALSDPGLERGWSSTIVVVAALGGANMLMTGVIGLYVGRIYAEAKGRPLYIVERAVGFEEAPASGRRPARLSRIWVAASCPRASSMVVIATSISARDLRSLRLEQRLLFLRAAGAHHRQAVDQSLVRRLLDVAPHHLDLVDLGEAS